MRAQGREGTGVLEEGKASSRPHSKEGERRHWGGGAEEHGFLSAGGMEGTRPSSRDYQLSAVGLSPPAPGTERRGDEPCLLLESTLPPGMPGQRSLGSRLRGSGQEGQCGAATEAAATAPPGPREVPTLFGMVPLKGLCPAPLPAGVAVSPPGSPSSHCLSCLPSQIEVMLPNGKQVCLKKEKIKYSVGLSDLCSGGHAALGWWPHGPWARQLF